MGIGQSIFLQFEQVFEIVLCEMAFCILLVINDSIRKSFLVSLSLEDFLFYGASLKCKVEIEISFSIPKKWFILTATNR